MTEITYIDPRCKRSGWGSGEWRGEPDKVQWTDPATGLACLAKRNPNFGNWCGYVGIGPDHPWHGKGYGDLPDGGPSVHGGLTYASKCEEGPAEETICHVPAAGEPDHLWWFGFDCAHGGDLTPGMPSLLTFGLGDVYRPLPYVRSECARLAAQIATCTVADR